MNNTTWKRFLTLALTALFVLAAHSATLAQGRPGGGGGRPSGQRPNRENSPYKDKYKNGQVRPPESRGIGRPQGTFPRN